MVMVLTLILAVVFGYLLGSIPTAWIVTRYLCVGSADIRMLGDGNMGATNTSRLLGWRWGVIVGSVDIFKGFVAAGAFALLGGMPGPVLGQQDFPVLIMVSGMSAMAGHIWPIWLRFRGGRGAATAVGITGAVIPGPMLIIALPTALILMWRRNTTLAFGFIMLWSNVVGKLVFDVAWVAVAYAGALFAVVVLTDPRLRIIKKPAPIE